MMSGTTPYLLTEHKGSNYSEKNNTPRSEIAPLVNYGAKPNFYALCVIFSTHPQLLPPHLLYFNHKCIIFVAIINPTKKSCYEKQTPINCHKLFYCFVNQVQDLDDLRSYLKMHKPSNVTDTMIDNFINYYSSNKPNENN